MGTGKQLMERYDQKCTPSLRRNYPVQVQRVLSQPLRLRRGSTPRNDLVQNYEIAKLLPTVTLSTKNRYTQNTHMKRFLFFILFSACALLGAAQVEKNLVYDGNAEIRKHQGFTVIEVSSAIDLYLSQGTEEAVAVSANDDEIVKRIRTEMRGTVLRIYFDGKGLNWRKWNNNKMKAYVTFKAITGVEASGACNVKVSGKIKAEQLRIQMSGASDFKGVVEGENLKLEASGASRIQVTGTVVKLNIDANGASDIRCYDLSSDYCKIDATGASVARISVNKELSAQASGASSIYYKGEGLIRDINTSGSSSIKRRSGD